MTFMLDTMLGSFSHGIDLQLMFALLFKVTMLFPQP